MSQDIQISIGSIKKTQTQVNKGMPMLCIFWYMLINILQIQFVKIWAPEDKLIMILIEYLQSLTKRDSFSPTLSLCIK